MELLYVVYSHSDFDDILKISSDYLSVVKNKILLINKNDKNLSEIYSKFNNVIFYNDELTYSDRLSSSLKQIDAEYIIFTHEIDILIEKNDSILNKFVEIMQLESIDRIDLQVNGSDTNKEFIKIKKEIDVNQWEKLNIDNINDYDYYLGLNTNPRNYIYNVNPSIWKKSSFEELMLKFKARTYRNIEFDDVQDYCTKYKICNLFSKHVLECGYFKCLSIYKYLHITHFRRLLRYDGTFKTEFNQSYKDAGDEYSKIIVNYNLKNGKRLFS